MKYMKHTGTMALLAVLCGAAGCATSRFGADGVAYVCAEDLKAASCGFGLRTVADKSVRGRPLTVAGKTYGRGIGICTCSGMLAATVFGIAFVPALYAFFERMARRRPRLLAEHPAAGTPGKARQN